MVFIFLVAKVFQKGTMFKRVSALNSHMRYYVTQQSATRLCGTAPPPPGKTSFGSLVKINFQPFLLILGVHIGAFNR